MKTLRHAIAIAMGVCALASTSNIQATPYASAITNLNGNGTAGGTIQYRLNEPCTNVYVLLYPGGVSNNLGMNGTYTPTPANGACVGAHTFSLGSYTSFAIVCTNVGTGTPHWISPANGTTQAAGSGFNPGTNNIVDFEGPRGVAVNTNASSPYFGMIYVCNASPGTDGTGRHTGKGLYAINPDFTDPFGYGTNPMPTGVTWGTSTTYACYHCYVGPDDMVYATDAGTGTTLGGGLWMFPPNLSSYTDLYQHTTAVAGTVGNVFDIEAAQIQGSYAAGTMTVYTMEYDRTNEQAVWQYPFYSAPGTPITLPWSPTMGAPGNPLYPPGTCGNDPYGNTLAYYNNSTLASGFNGQVGCGYYGVLGVTSDFAIAPDGKFFCTEYRSTATNVPSISGASTGDRSGNVGLWIFDSVANGNCMLWNSMDQNGGVVDAVDPVASVAISPDDLFIAMGGTTISASGGNSAFAGQIEYAPLNYTNLNGVSGLPNLADLQSFKFNTSANEGLRQTCFDLADNIYSESGSSSDTMREFTLGLTSVAITSNDYTGANGSFSVTYPTYATTFPTLTTVSVSPTVAVASTNYGSPIVGEITITRTVTNGSLTVNYTLSGTGTNGTDYKLSSSSGSVTFAAGVSSETIYITNIEPTNVSLPTLSVVLNLTPNPLQFAIIGATNATVSLANEGPQELVVSGTGAGTMYRAFSNDFVTFTVARYGDTNAAMWTLPFSAFSLGGTAVYSATPGPGVDYTGGPQPVVYGLANSSVAGTSGYASGGITVNPGDTSEVVEVGLPLTHASFTGAKTIVLSGTGGTSVEGTNYSFTAATATALLLDNLDPAESVLWADSLSSPTDTNNWSVTFSTNGANIQYYWQYYNGIPGGSPGTLANFDADFGYGYLLNDNPNYNYDLVPYPPSGATNVLRVTVDKNISIPAQAAGVNLYPNNAPVFSGNYALRFDMNLVRGCSDSVATDYALFGINHFGTNINWWLAATVAGGFTFTNADGIWFNVAADAGQGSFPPGDFAAQTSINGSTVGVFPNTGYENLAGAEWISYTNVFKGFNVAYNAPDSQTPFNTLAPPYTGYETGVPANASGWNPDAYEPEVSACTPPNGETVGPWTQVEVKQYDNVITMSLNKTIIFVYTNTTIFKSGTPMLGYMRPYTSEGVGGGVYYSNLRVVSLAGPTITGVTISGGNVVITFTSPDAEAAPSSFSLYSSSAVGGHYASTAATITESNGVFTAVTPYTAAASQYFVVKQTNVSQ